MGSLCGFLIRKMRTKFTFSTWISISFQNETIQTKARMPQIPPPLGIDSLLKNETLLKSLSKKNVGLITNQSSLTQDYIPSAYALRKKLGAALKCIFVPEHGWSGLIGEGIGITDGFDPHLELPILSLYGKNKKFVPFIIDNTIDVILIDLQDIGLRCYTYIATCAKFLEACAELPLEIIVCDRPNPLGSQQKGPLLDPDFRSLLAYLDVPFQHGQTIGQLLSAFNQTMGKPLPLTVLPCQPVHHPYHYPWTPPSPNLPSWESVLLYPALVLLEGINVSEGRGTTLPFTSIGAPGLDHYRLVDFLNVTQSSVRARPITFTPQSGKLKNIECQGAHLLVQDPSSLNALSLGINILRFLKENYASFSWEKMSSSSASLQGKERYFIDYLLGTASVRESIGQGVIPLAFPPPLDTKGHDLLQHISV